MTAAELAIRLRIQERGKITFAEFMQLALYHPVDGYYSSEAPFGTAGDYYTSPAVHPAFGALLSVQLFVMWQRLAMPDDFTVVELGAGAGLLAQDIVAYAESLSADFAGSLRYVCVDRYSPTQADPAEDATTSNLEWLLADELPLRGVVGCFISNELLDAFPVHRFQIADGAPLESYVALDDKDEFAEVLDKPSDPRLAERIGGLNFTLADGHRGEVCLRVRPWVAEVSRALRQGFVMTIDYGYTARELYSPSRSHGTLQTYFRHTEGSSPYLRVGRQDITAHVDFSLLQAEGALEGLNALEFTTQGRFLTDMGIGEMMLRLRELSLSQYDSNANIMALRELVKPDGLGAFKVLIQEKGTSISSGSQLRPSQSMREGLIAPLLSDRHMPLMEGRYPHTTWEASSLWGEWRPAGR